MKKIMKEMLILVLASHLSFTFDIKTKPKKAVVIVPIADLVGQEMGKLSGPQPVQHAYGQLPVCGGNTAPEIACFRIHQLLFNEVVEILEEKEQEIHIRIPDLFYLIPTSNKPQITYWTLKKNIIAFDKIQKHTGDLTKIPLPLSFKNNIEQSDRHNIVTLIEPWFDKKTKQTFSAGTRFVYAMKKKKKIDAYLFNPQTMQYHIAQIPNNKCMTYNTVYTPKQKRNNFITILRQWTKKNEYFIPYVLGGCSFAGMAKGSFDEITYKTITKKTTSCFVLKNKMTSPKTGLDCTGMIARAAQMCEIPYFCKNTTTIKRCLTPLSKGNKPKPGDIIWIPGHVMVITDLANNTLIEARGYKDGYGKVHEIPLNEEFKGINTYHNLINAYHNNKAIIRLDRNGNEQETITNLKLLQLTNKTDKHIS